MSSQRDLFNIRMARLDDATRISKIHCSHVPNWYRKTGGEHCDVTCDELTLDERWGFGGPWMSVESCSIHLNNLLLRRCIPIVAEQGDRLVAEMELFISREGPPYNKNCHIGLLYVDKSFTGRGIGKKMVERAKEIAMYHHCDTLTVSSQAASENFYGKCGFTFSDVMVEIEARTRNYGVAAIALPPPVNAQSFTWGMGMKIGRYQSSAFHLFELADAYALPVYGHMGLRSAAFSISGHPSLFANACSGPADVAAAVAWTEGAEISDLVAAELAWLNSAGIKAANMLITKKDYDALDDRIESRLIGHRRSMVNNLRVDA